jgi:coenzyme PQQ synthesis protein D (PqqD)
MRHALRTTDRVEWGEPMYRVSEGVRSTHGQDGAIVLDVQQGQMFNLNCVGSRILELLEGGSEEDDIVNVISHEFNTGREVVENDVREFIEALRKNKLILDR